MLKIRTISPSDYEHIEQLIRMSFAQSEYGYNKEAELVAAIRKTSDYKPTFEVVAIENDQIVGHALLSIVSLSNKLFGLALAPIAVTPSYQNKGIGKLLILELEKQAIEQSYPFITILGNPNYYAKFGYSPASQFKICAPFEVPEEAFLIKPLIKQALDNTSGTIQYSSAFDTL